MIVRVLLLMILGLTASVFHKDQVAYAFCETYEPCEDQEPDEDHPGPDGPSRPDPEPEHDRFQDPLENSGW